jgi:hypothetical protein
VTCIVLSFFPHWGGRRASPSRAADPDPISLRALPVPPACGTQKRHCPGQCQGSQTPRLLAKVPGRCEGEIGSVSAKVGNRCAPGSGRVALVRVEGLQPHALRCQNLSLVQVQGVYSAPAPWAYVGASDAHRATRLTGNGTLRSGGEHWGLPVCRYSGVAVNHGGIVQRP